MSPIIATTFCPGASPLPAGAASTAPAASIPGTRGKLTPALRPSRSFSSERLRPNASTRMRTQPSRPGASGSVVSPRLSTGPGAASRTAPMAAARQGVIVEGRGEGGAGLRQWPARLRGHRRRVRYLSPDAVRDGRPGDGAEQCEPDRAADLLGGVEQAGGDAGVLFGHVVQGD